MSDTDILIANYQSIIRVLASQVRTLELQFHLRVLARRPDRYRDPDRG